MKFLNLTGFKLNGTDMYAKKLFINADHVVSVKTDGATTTIYTTAGSYSLDGNVTEPIMYQLTGREQ